MSELYKPEYVPGLHEYEYVPEIHTQTIIKINRKEVCVHRAAQRCEYVPELYKYGCVPGLHEYEYVLEPHRHIHPCQRLMCRCGTKFEYVLERRRYEYASD